MFVNPMAHPCAVRVADDASIGEIALSKNFVCRAAIGWVDAWENGFPLIGTQGQGEALDRRCLVVNYHRPVRFYVRLQRSIGKLVLIHPDSCDETKRVMCNGNKPR